MKHILTIDKARELISVQINFGSGYNRNTTRLILAEIEKDVGHASVNQLIREFRLDEVFGFKLGSSFSR